MSKLIVLTVVILLVVACATMAPPTPSQLETAGANSLTTPIPSPSPPEPADEPSLQAPTATATPVPSPSPHGRHDLTSVYTETTTTLGTRQVTVFHITTPLPTLTPATATLNPEIIEFAVSPLKANHGNPITLTWKVIADQASISYLNNAGRLSVPISVPLIGGLVFTTSSNPRDDDNLAFYLFASSGDVSTQAEVEIEFICSDSWFFPNPPESCPLAVTHYPNMIAQRFEHGVMIQNEANESDILVLYQTGKASYVDGAWSTSMPEYDPDIIPPSGYYQPVRSFGMVWREHPEIREQLGWAIDEEVTIDGMVQCDTLSKYPKCYMTGLDNQIYVLEMFGLTWQERHK